MKQLNTGSSRLFVCIVVLACSQVLANTITVTNTADTGPGSLRGAITSAVSGDTINFNLSYPATITLSSTLAIGTNLTISGPGRSNLVISGNNSVRVFYVNSGVTATISGVTIRNGRDDPSDPYGGGGIYNAGELILNNCTITGNSAGVGGGVANSGTLTVNNSTVSANSAFINGTSAGQGGGILNYGPLTVNNSTISGNSANYAAGVFSGNVRLTITSSTLSGNSANYDGGGIYHQSGPVTVTDSTLSGNSAGQQGGGIFNYNGTLIVRNSTLSGNSAPNGGGIYNYGDTTVINGTLSGNRATAGAGIFNVYRLAVSNSTIAANFADYGGGGIYSSYTLILKNTILARNVGGNGGNCQIVYPLTSGGYNLSDDTDCFLSGIGDRNSTPAGLDPTGLQNNGGPTQTIALLANGAAMDAIPIGPTNYCTTPDGVTLTVDQRGVARPQNSGCDIGAYESTAPVDSIGPITSNVSITSNPLALNTSSSLLASVSDAATGGSKVTSAVYTVDGGSASQMFLTPSGAVTTQASATVAPFSQANVYNVCVHGRDEVGNDGADFCILLPVYDPSGSFVTGSGQIASPAGADLLNPSAVGQATFGFVSKYLPGRNTPSGNLEFQFKEGNLNFKSTSMDWLVVTGEPRAKFHGIGTVNGTSVCNFEVDAWDGSFMGNVDAFGLKISSCSNGYDRYNLGPTRLIQGNIIIHQ